MNSLPGMIARRFQPRPASAFTMIELLVVIGTVALLVVMLAPALAATKPNGKMAQCLNNQRQLALAWQMYSSDNSDLIVTPTVWVSSSSFMDWTSSSANTNTAYLTNSSYALFATYIKSAAVYKCPADFYRSAANPGPRVRSVSLNGALGSTPVFENQTGKTYFSAHKMNDLSKPGPASVFLFIDEHPDSIDDGIFMENPGYAPGNEHWRNLPASYNNNGAGVSFADGHTEMHIWQNVTGLTSYPVIFSNYGGSPPWVTMNLGVSPDYEWFENRMPYH